MSVQTEWYKVKITIHQTILVQIDDHGDNVSNEEDALEEIRDMLRTMKEDQA